MLTGRCPCVRERTGAEPQEVTSRKQDIPTHDWGSQAAKQHCRGEQIFPAIVKVDGAKRKLCLMTSSLRASAKSCAGRDTALKKHQEPIAAGMGVVRTHSRKGVGQGNTCRKSLSGETIFPQPHLMFKSPSQTRPGDPSPRQWMAWIWQTLSLSLLCWISWASSEKVQEPRNW